MVYRLTVLTVKTNNKVISEHATFTEARCAANAILDRDTFAEDTAVKIRDANAALLFYQFRGAIERDTFREASGRWYVRIHNIVRGKFKGKRFASEIEARGHWQNEQYSKRDYDTAFLLFNPSGDLVEYVMLYGEGDPLETRPPNSED